MIYTYDVKAVREAIKAAGGPAVVAARAGMSRVGVAYWCRGVTEPSCTSLAKLASVLRCSPAAFFRRGA
jgi:transcriptional regulator with XRE-family HTH domain